jgi:Phosphoesterase family
MTGHSRDNALDHMVVVVRLQSDAVPGRVQHLEYDPADRLGRTRRHLRPRAAPAVPTPDPAAPEGQLGFAFDRSGYRVPAIVISPWVAEGEVFNAEHRHTSLIATLREQWALGDPLTARDAAARTFTHTLTLDTPRDPRTWPAPDPRQNRHSTSSVTSSPSSSPCCTPPSRAPPPQPDPPM